MYVPSETAANGRLANGKFGKGNRFAKGNPNAARVANLRQTLLSAVKPADLKEIVQTLVQQAKNGDLNAAREVFDRVLGRAVASVNTTLDVTSTRGAREEHWGGLSPDKIERLSELDELMAKPIPSNETTAPGLPLSQETPTPPNENDIALRLSA